MRKTQRDMQKRLRRRLVTQLIEEAHPIPAEWDDIPEEALNLDALDRMMAFRSHPLFYEIRAALERMEGGTYGQCTLCRDVIPAKSLMSDPTARFCAGCGGQLQPQSSRLQYASSRKRIIDA